MKVVALIGGLGSQMFKYAFYLALKESTEQECFIDTTFFEQRESWNGYELKKIFGIEASDIKSELSDMHLKELISKEKNYIDICLEHLVSNADTEYYFLGKKKVYKKGKKINSEMRELNQKVLFLENFIGIKYQYTLKKVLSSNNAYFNEYAHNSDEHFKEYKDLIKTTFKFPKFEDKKNIDISKKMFQEESVAIHIRRTDHMTDNVKLFKNGFFKRAVNYIRCCVKNKLSFYIFSDDLEWCKNNIAEIGLKNGDDIFFVDWNSGKESYRDMQLMTYCKHNIVPISSFSWWGYYLSNRTDKIVCAPNGYWNEIENHF